MTGTTLVLGGSGFLGAHVVRAALAGGGAVVSASREPEIAPGFTGVDGARTLRVDALNSGELERALDEIQPERVIVCTALARIAECQAYPGLAGALNVEFPARVATWTAVHAAKLVLVSSDLVYGATRPRAGGFREEDPAAPLSEYGRTKAAGEAAVLARDERALVVRLPLLHGDSGGRGLGASDSVLAAIARGERPVFFTDEWRTPLDVAIAARALVDLARRDMHGLLHVAGRERIDRHELAVRVLCAAGKSDSEARACLRASTRSDAGLESSRPEDASLCSDRALELLGHAAWIAREP